MKKFILIALILTIFLLVGCGENNLNNSYLKSSIKSENSKNLSIKSEGVKSEVSVISNVKSEELISVSLEKSSNKSINSIISSSVEKSISVENPTQKIRPIGVWWWSDSLGDEYLEFAYSRGVNEIYYCASDFSTATYTFIKKAKEKNIKVYWLGGEYSWTQNSENLYKKLNSYIEYQNTYSDAQFSGVHLDIEPHQNPDWKGTDKTSPIRVALIQELIDLAEKLKNDFPTLNFSYDLPFWLDYEISYNGKTKIAYEAMIDIADRVFLMSYRDTAEGIYSVSSDEINYAKSVNKSVFLGIETYSSEGDNVSFWEEGEKVMLEEMEKLKLMVDESFGFSVHHMKRWYEFANT